MRVPALSGLLLLGLALFIAGCGGPSDPDAALTAACKRQIEEVVAEGGDSSIPTAKSTEDKLSKEVLQECAGQKITLATPEGENVNQQEDTKADQEGSKSEEAAADAEQAADTGKTGQGEGQGAADAAQDQGETAGELSTEAREQFATTCGGCHALSDADTSGAVGPNLDDTTMTADQIEQQIINGGGAMPPGLLQGADAAAVAQYVAAAAAQ